ncbi:MAG TPA: CsbD family protein [Actinomycetota bacterium]|nr:CsbD family protein [Actinomycetota bacterium]
MTDAGEGIKGKVKEAAGAVSDDDRLRAEGKAQQDKADAEREASRREAEADAARTEAASHEAEQRRHQ